MTEQVEKLQQSAGSKGAYIIFSILFSFGLLLTFLQALPAFFQNPKPLAPFIAGLVAWFLIWRNFFNNSEKILRQTWEHELTHALFCLLTFTPIHEFRFSKTPYELLDNLLYGHVRHDQAPGFRGKIITLSPYFFPTFTVAFLILLQIAKESTQSYFEVCIGVSFGFYLVNRYEYIRLAIKAVEGDEKESSDFAKNGIPLSLAFAILGNLIVMPSILFVLHQGWGAAGKHCVSGGRFWFNLLFS